MSGSIRLADERRYRFPLKRLSHWKLEASFWTGFLVFGWEMPPIRSLFVADMPTFVEWIAVGLAAVAMVTAMRAKRGLSQKSAAEEARRAIAAPNSLSLVELLREHGVREFGSMYLYMPMPKRDLDDAAWAWITTLQAEGLIKGDQWHVRADHIKETIRNSHGCLFTDDTTHFDVYRLDWQALSRMMGDELP